MASAGQSTMLRTQLRPTRLAFLLPKDSPEALRRAISTASTVWGGMRSVLLPIDADQLAEPPWTAFLKAASPDHIVVLGSSFAGATQYIRSLGVKCSLQTLTSQLPGQPQLSSPVIFVPPPARHQMHLLAAHLSSDSDELSSWQPAQWIACGASSVTNNPCIEVGIDVQASSDWEHILLAQIAGTTVLALTALNDTDGEMPPRFPRLTTVAMLWVVTASTSQEDLMRIWNYRALRPVDDAIMQRLSLIGTDEAFNAPAVVEAARDAIAQLARSSPAIMFDGTVDDAQHLSVFLTGVGAVPFHGTVSDEAPSSGERSMMYMPGNAGEHWLDPRLSGLYSDQPVVLTPQRTTIRYLQPVDVFPPYVSHGRLRVTANLITGPRRDGVAALYLPGAVWDKTGVSLPVEHFEKLDLNLNLPDPEDVLQASISVDYGPRAWSLNDKGKHVMGIIERLNSAEVDLDLLQNRAFYEVSRALTPQPDRDLKHEVRRLAEQSDALTNVDIIEALGKVYRPSTMTFDQLCTKTNAGDDEAKKTLSTVLADMTRASLLEHVLPFRCSVCGLSAFLSLPAAVGRPICTGCGSFADYTNVEPGPPRLAFRGTTLLTRAFENGSLVPAAATVGLRRTGAFVLPGVDIKLSLLHSVASRLFAQREAERGVHSRDVDLIGWTTARLFSAEAKRSIAALKAEGFAKSLEIATALGVDEHYFVCFEDPDDEVRGEAVEAGQAAKVDVQWISGSALFH